MRFDLRRLCLTCSFSQSFIGICGCSVFSLKLKVLSLPQGCTPLTHLSMSEPWFDSLDSSSSILGKRRAYSRSRISCFCWISNSNFSCSEAFFFFKAFSNSVWFLFDFATLRFLRFPLLLSGTSFSIKTFWGKLIWRWRFFRSIMFLRSVVHLKTRRTSCWGSPESNYTSIIFRGFKPHDFPLRLIFCDGFYKNLLKTLNLMGKYSSRMKLVFPAFPFVISIIIMLGRRKSYANTGAQYRAVSLDCVG